MRPIEIESLLDEFSAKDQTRMSDYRPRRLQLYYNHCVYIRVGQLKEHLYPAAAAVIAN